MLKTNKGFSMLEMIICLFIISSISILCLTNFEIINLDYYYYLSDYLYNQSLAILDKQNRYIDYNVRFNSMGHVNKAQTINIGKHYIIIHLGNGYLSYE